MTVPLQWAAKARKLSGKCRFAVNKRLLVTEIMQRCGHV